MSTHQLTGEGRAVHLTVLQCHRPSKFQENSLMEGAERISSPVGCIHDSCVHSVCNLYQIRAEAAPLTFPMCVYTCTYIIYIIYTLNVQYYIYIIDAIAIYVCILLLPHTLDISQTFSHIFTFIISFSLIGLYFIL